jgi:hypothetical protein
MERITSAVRSPKIDTAALSVSLDSLRHGVLRCGAVWRAPLMAQVPCGFSWPEEQRR